MNKIITVTLNPSLDVTMVTERLDIGYYNRVARAKHLDASGRGMNVSRALSRLDAPTHALVTLGDDAISYAYKGIIDSETFPMTIIQHAGHTRSDTIILHSKRSLKTETHIIDENSICTEEDVQILRKSLKELISAGDIVVLAGNLPPQTRTNVYVELTEFAHECEARVVIVVGGELLHQTMLASPEIVVLRQMEIERLFNYPVRTLSDMISTARKLQSSGCEEVLMVTNDYETVVLVNQHDVLLAEIDDVQLWGTKSGVVDAMLAAYLCALLKQDTREKAMKFAASAMAYTAEEIGNEFASMEKIQEELKRVRVRTIAGAKI